MHHKIVHSMVFAAFTVSSCAANSLGPSELTSTDALVRELQQQGATVTRAAALPQSAYPFFSVKAQRIVVNGEDVQVFVYQNTTRADSDASRVSPTGTPIGQSQIGWMDTPNFYKRDRLIVLYVGHSTGVTKPLEGILGPPFAFGR
jgi:hypothetical protein